MKILLIEPNLLLGDIYKKALKNAGHVVKSCTQAQNSILESEEFKPDLIILELQLPGHNGVEFLYEFRSYPEWQSIPVLLHTWVSDRFLNINSLSNVGVVGYLYKPATNLKRLVRTVSELNLKATI